MKIDDVKYEEVKDGICEKIYPSVICGPMDVSLAKTNLLFNPTSLVSNTNITWKHFNEMVLGWYFERECWFLYEYQRRPVWDRKNCYDQGTT